MKHLRAHRGRRVNIYMDGVTLQGVVIAAGTDGVELGGDVRVLAEGAPDWMAVEGNAVIPAPSIAWVQVVTQ